jgi:hypothetical protein
MSQEYLKVSDIGIIFLIEGNKKVPVIRTLQYPDESIVDLEDCTLTLKAQKYDFINHEPLSSILDLEVDGSGDDQGVATFTIDEITLEPADYKAEIEVVFDGDGKLLSVPNLRIRVLSKLPE